MMSDRYSELLKHCLKYCAIVIILLVLFISAVKTNTDPDTGEISTMGGILAIGLLIAIAVILVFAIVTGVKGFRQGIKDLKDMKHDPTQDL